MKDRIIEIVELGQPQSLIQRENALITELIKTDLLVEELNEQLRLYNVSGSLPSLNEIQLEPVCGSTYCQYSVIEQKLAILYQNQEKILQAIKLLGNDEILKAVKGNHCGNI